MYGYSLDVYSIFARYIYQTCIAPFCYVLRTPQIFKELWSPKDVANPQFSGETKSQGNSDELRSPEYFTIFRFFTGLRLFQTSRIYGLIEPFLWTSPSLPPLKSDGFASGFPRNSLSPTEKYIQTQTTRFVKTFSEETKSPGFTKIDYNSAIHPVFYSPKELADVLNDEANALEPEWRTKILVEPTPRGNIVMFYDAFKQAFAYYTDQTSIPYPILNAVAMKYVILFRCRDFFVDQYVLPENVSSGITSAYAVIEKEKTRAKKEKTPSLTQSAFVKFKSYNSVSSKANGYTPKSSENVSTKSNEEQAVSPKLMNKHISLGKICNFSFIQKPRVNRTPTIESALMPKPRLSYADYKRLAGERGL